MSSLSKNSIYRLQTCHPKLQKIFLKLAETLDFTVIEGHREVKLQEELYAKGLTKLKFGKHNKIPSEAIDIAPNPIDWKNIKRFYEVHKMVMEIAKDLDIAVRWGGDWDQDGDFKDQTFNDLVHFELV